MKKILFALFVSACKSECLDYATVSCGKIALCVTPVERKSCEEETLAQLSAQRITEELCQSTREKITPMSCIEYKAFLNAAVQ